ncbi:Tol biopolymer transport system component [Sphingomonas kyeonggiensis]|uniref:Tol biopolymer transport system component n=1 Tax=Sphingomonas kyeonggiensis TaxID=1268553 RepID=A0A7W7NRS3_9SPHN|nr:hypothetical protein [Sphingomonas kyeonggiensis]MBB4838112.1 Tol biopolymer transport system component [Sphingomonas kyeonggiensis]
MTTVSKAPPGANPAHGPFRPLLPGQVSQVRIIRRDGSEDRLVLEADRLLEAPNWTPDGGALIVNGGGHLFRLKLAGAPVLEPIAIDGIDDANNDHLLSPDGRTLYITAARKVHAVPVTGGTPRQVSPADGLAYYLHGISPDGSALACATIRPGEVLRWGIAIVPEAGGPARQLLEGPAPVDGPEWSPDGAWIWFNGELEASVPGDASLFRMRPDGSGIERRSEGNRVDWFPHPDPAGETIAYISFPEGTEGHPPNLPVELRAMPAEGGAVRTIASFFGGQGSINVNSWSPDGEWLAYVAYPVG